MWKLLRTNGIPMHFVCKFWLKGIKITNLLRVAIYLSLLPPSRQLFFSSSRSPFPCLSLLQRCGSLSTSWVVLCAFVWFVLHICVVCIGHAWHYSNPPLIYNWTFQNVSIVASAGDIVIVRLSLLFFIMVIHVLTHPSYRSFFKVKMLSGFMTNKQRIWLKCLFFVCWLDLCFFTSIPRSYIYWDQGVIFEKEESLILVYFMCS